jgi:hypothetical protein
MLNTHSCEGETVSKQGEHFLNVLEQMFSSLSKLQLGLPLYFIWNTKQWKIFDKAVDELEAISGTVVEVNLKLI